LLNYTRRQLKLFYNYAIEHEVDKEKGRLRAMISALYNDPKDTMKSLNQDG